MLEQGVSQQAMLDQYDIQESGNEPGPGHYHTARSSLGDQSLGKNPNAPHVVFPNTGWGQWDKVLVTKAHLKSQKCRDGPGHPYSPKDSSVEFQGIAGRAGTFGAADRPDLSGQLGAAGGQGSPGPNINLREMSLFDLGVDQYAKGRSMKDRNSFGLSQRFGKDKDGGLGPGTYARTDSALRLGNGRSFGIGRNYYDRVVRPGWEKEGQCKASKDVGPPLWADISRDGSRATSIGRAQRFPEFKVDDGPGPGQYRRDERDVAVNASFNSTKKKGGSAVSDTKSPGCPQFGKPPRKPRWRTTLATTTAQRGGWGYF